MGQNGVSILVFLDGALKAFNRISHKGTNKVSILVFLDGALKACRLSLTSAQYWSFNPCFSGWRSERSCLGEARRIKFCFNPCFSGWRSESSLGDPVRYGKSSFNPCFSGWRSERISIRRDHLLG